MHLLMYTFSLKDSHCNIDMRNIPTCGRHGVKLVVKKVNNPRYYSIYYRAVDAWNKLEATYTTMILLLTNYKCTIKLLLLILI